MVIGGPRLYPRLTPHCRAKSAAIRPSIRAEVECESQITDWCLLHEDLSCITLCARLYTNSSEKEGVPRTPHLGAGPHVSRRTKTGEEISHAEGFDPRQGSARRESPLFQKAAPSHSSAGFPGFIAGRGNA